jgi:hypothetical protein
MTQESGVDLSFLDDDDGINGFVDGLFHASVLFLRNEFEEPQILHISDVMPLSNIISMYVANDMKTLQVVVPNGDPSTKTQCPYIRIIMDHCHGKTPVNYKLEHLLRRLGVETVNPRCNTAIVVGIANTNRLDDLIGLPDGFAYARVDQLARFASLSECPPHLPTPGEILPQEIMQYIFLFMSTPSADIIRKDFKRVHLYLSR